MLWYDYVILVFVENYGLVWVILIPIPCVGSWMPCYDLLPRSRQFSQHLYPGCLAHRRLPGARSHWAPRGLVWLLTFGRPCPYEYYCKGGMARATIFLLTATRARIKKQAVFHVGKMYKSIWPAVWATVRFVWHFHTGCHGLWFRSGVNVWLVGWSPVWCDVLMAAKHNFR